MNNSEKSPKTLRLGITMAGAVSAGAYTAGVIDYLVEVLDKWEELKKTNPDSVPSHQIRIDVLAGASAGGMTASILSTMLQEKHFPLNPNEKKKGINQKQNKLYDSWVNLLQDDMYSLMLELGDLKEREDAVSLFDSDFIEKIAENIFANIQPTESVPNYVNEKCEMVLTLSNVDGFEYEFSVNQGNINTFSNYQMKEHRDTALFRFNEDKYKADGRIPIDYKSTLSIEKVELLRKCTIATGAFPIGLAYRTFARESKYIVENPFNNVNGYRPKNIFEPHKATFVDGGLINNEPFDLAHSLLNPEYITKSEEEKRVSSQHQNFDSTVILIDPFPCEDNCSSTIEMQQKYPMRKFPFDLIDIILKIITTLRTQAMLKKDELKKVYDEDDYSNFMISPRRKVNVDTKEEKKIDGCRAIACGCLEGFGGFLDKEFREHDFYLGRINCRNFLEKHFSVPANTTNPIFTEGYSVQSVRDKYTFQDKKTRESFLPIIPILELLDSTLDMDEGNYKRLKFPKYDFSKFEAQKQQLLNRLLIVLQRSMGFGVLASQLVNIIYSFFKGKLFQQIKKIVIKSMDDWDLL